MEATEPMTLEQAAEGLIQVPEAEDVEAEEVEAEEVEETAETDEVEAEAEEADDTEEVEEADSEDDEEDDEQEVEEELQTFTVKVDGQEQEVTLEELTRGYAGQSYIQEGMAKNAEARKEIETRVKETEAVFAQLNQQRAQLGQLVQTLQTEGLKQPTPPDPALAQSDPIGWTQQNAEYQQEVVAYNAKLQAVHQQQQQAEQAQAVAMQKHLAEQRQILESTVPGYGTPETQESLKDTGVSYGFSVEEVSGITDARMVQVLHDAMLYRQTKAKTEAVKAKAKKARPVTKPKAKQVRDPSRKQREKQRAKFKKTGSLDDAVALILET